MAKPVRGELKTIPGVGPRFEFVLEKLGYRRVDDLAGSDPERMYDKLCDLEGTRLDRCVLYVFRCASYFASNTKHDPELLNWWNWTDDKRPR